MRAYDLAKLARASHCGIIGDPQRYIRWSDRELVVHEAYVDLKKYKGLVERTWHELPPMPRGGA